MTRRLLFALFVIVAVVGAAACNTGARLRRVRRPPSRMRLPAPNRCVNKLFQLLHDKDSAGLEAFLSPAFTLQRADGSSADKADFIQRPADVVEFTISGLTATQTGNVMVARYMADVVGTTNGRPYSPGPAPRMSVFLWDGTDWQLVAHANFNPLAG